MTCLQDATVLFIPTSPSLTSVCDLTGLYQPQRDRRASLVPQGPRGREMGGGGCFPLRPRPSFQLYLQPSFISAQGTNTASPPLPSLTPLNPSPSHRMVVLFFPVQSKQRADLADPPLSSTPPLQQCARAKTFLCQRLGPG